jgi:hypothetical protein
MIKILHVFVLNQKRQFFSPRPQVLKLQRTVTATKEDLGRIERLAKNFDSGEKNRARLWSADLTKKLNKLAEFCGRGAAVVGHVSNDAMFEVNFDFAGLKKEAERVGLRLADYAKIADVIRSCLAADAGDGGSVQEPIL